MVLLSGATVGGTALAVGGVGGKLFKYNRENFQFDMTLRYTRFVAGYTMACEQAEMYREDIADLTALTTMKMDRLHAVGGTFFVNFIQLIMAGRLGVHGPSPPGWLLVIYWCVSTFAGFWLVTLMWLAYHASARAQAAGIRLRTYSVRLPIPSPMQLDKARAAGNDFEKQRAGDMFRVPWALRAPHEDDAHVDQEKASVPGKKKKSKFRQGFEDNRVPVWFADEKREQHGGEGSPSVEGAVSPEHLEQLRGVQQEFWAFDVYARIAYFLCWSNWLWAVNLYIMCHCFTELRTMWPAWTCTFCFITANYCLIFMDVDQSVQIPGSMNIRAEYFAPLTPLLCVFGMNIDYSIIPAADGWRGLIYGLSVVCYIFHILWCLRLLEICAPREPTEEMEEQPGQPWWPADWWVPPCWAHCCNLVAASRTVPGQRSCLQQEMKASKNQLSAGAGPKAEKRLPKELNRSVQGWRHVRGGLAVQLFLFCMVTCGRVFEMINGERLLLKQEGRVERWPSHMQPWITPWTRQGVRHEWSHTGGSDRRLTATDHTRNAYLSEAAKGLISVLGSVVDAMEQPAPAPRSSGEPAELLAREAGAWPRELAASRPGLLACGGEDLLLALGADGQGALLGATVTPLNLELGTLGSVLGAGFSSGRLLIAGADGLAECAPKEHGFHCDVLPEQLPGLAAASAAVARVEGVLRAAVVAEEDSSLAVYELRDGHWEVTGEITVPFNEVSAPKVSFSSDGGAVLLALPGGGVLTWPLESAGPAPAAMPHGVASAHVEALQWEGACATKEGFARLAYTQKGDAWEPRIFRTQGL